MEKPRWFWISIVLLIIAILLSGAILVFPSFLVSDSPQEPVSSEREERMYAAFEEEIAGLLADHDKDLKAYRANLQEKGEKLWEEHQEELQANLEAEIADYRDQLDREAQEFAKELEEKYQNRLVNLKLQLVLVTLSAEELERKQEEIATLSQELTELSEGKEGELANKLTAFQKKASKRAEQLLEEFEIELEEQLNQEYRAYSGERQNRLEKEIAKRREALGRASASREY